MTNIWGEITGPCFSEKENHIDHTNLEERKKKIQLTFFNPFSVRLTPDLNSRQTNRRAPSASDS